jgi:hypothetical protein
VIAIALLAAGACAASGGSAGSDAPANVARGWDGFPVLVWRQTYFGKPLPERFRAAFGGANVVREEDAAWLLEAGLDFYVDHAAGRDSLHIDREEPGFRKRWNAWYEKRRDEDLVRVPCLNDPATRERLFAQLEKTLAARGGRSGLGASLGDEVSQTCGGSPEDICLCPHCRAKWRAFLAAARARGETELPEDFDPALASTDATRLALAEGRTEAVHAWLLRRRFQQDTLVDLLAELAAAARSRSKDTSLGLLGMIGQSTFGGVAVERILPHLDFAEAYRVSDARELLLTLRTDRQRILQTVFPEGGSPDASAWQAFDAWMHGADGLVLWSDRELERSSALFERLERAVRELRAIRAAAPGFRPLPQGVALVHSPDAVAYAWLRDALLDGPTWPRRFQGYHEEHGTLERELRAWWRTLEDAGAMPGAWPLGRVGRESVQRFPLLVLNQLALLDSADVARLREYLAAGGHVIVDGVLGELDAHGRAPPAPVLEELRKLAPERVHVLSAPLAGYLETRVDGAKPAAEVLGWLAQARVPLAPWHVSGAGREMAWRSTWSIDAASGLWTCATLPNLATREERAPALRAPPAARSDLELDIAPPDGFTLRWIHPALATDETQLGARTLRAGDAAVFQLIPAK